PVLREAVARKPQATLSQAEIDELCDRLSAEAWVLIDKLLAEALREAEESLRFRINDRLSDDLPALIEKTLRERLGADPRD
ncbi:MAG: hypothetical protein ACR2QG_01110, partial [Gammaproteobacteria bacterium]